MDVCILLAAAPYLPNLDDLDDKQAEEMLADMMFNDNDLSEYASISQLEDGPVSIQLCLNVCFLSYCICI